MYLLSKRLPSPQSTFPEVDLSRPILAMQCMGLSQRAVSFMRDGSRETAYTSGQWSARFCSPPEYLQTVLKMRLLALHSCQDRSEDSQHIGPFLAYCKQSYDRRQVAFRTHRDTGSREPATSEPSKPHEQRNHTRPNPTEQSPSEADPASEASERASKAPKHTGLPKYSACCCLSPRAHS